MELNQETTLENLINNPYFKLSVSLDNCQSNERATDIILNKTMTKLLYPTEKIQGFISTTLFHFCRSKIAVLQEQPMWFHKETCLMLEYWLSSEPYLPHYLGHLSNQYLTELTMFNLNHTPTNFPYQLSKISYADKISDRALVPFLEKLKMKEQMNLERHQTITKP